MSRGLSEAMVEEAGLGWFEDLGYQTKFGSEIAPDGPAPERVSFGDVLLLGRLRDALARLNPHLPEETRAEVIRRLRQSETPSLVEENRRIHRMIVDGVDVEVTRDDGSIAGDKAWLIDFDDPENNDWLTVNQFTVIENKNNRRPDVVVFVNGLPLGVVELKNPGDENATLEGAFNQLQGFVRLNL